MACPTCTASPLTVLPFTCTALYRPHCTAVKYADLKNHRTTNYRFSYDEMLSQQVRCSGWVAWCEVCFATIQKRSASRCVCV